VELADQLGQLRSFELVAEGVVDEPANPSRTNLRSDGGEDRAFDGGRQTLGAHSGITIPLTISTERAAYQPDRLEPMRTAANHPP